MANINSKLLIAVGVGSGIALAGAGLLWRSRKDKQPRCHHGHDHRQHEGEMLNPSPVISPATGVLRGWSPQQLEILRKMEAQFEEKNSKDGAHLDASFFSMKQDIVALRILNKVEQIKQGAIEKLAQEFHEMRFGHFSKDCLELSIQIAEVEEIEEDRIDDAFDDPIFIQASKVYQLRYNPDPLIRVMVTESNYKHQKYLNPQSRFDIHKLATYITSLIEKRLEKGFEFVDKTHFPYDFRVQLEAELYSRFGVSLDEFWAFCQLKDIGRERADWENMIEKYSMLLKSFYHGLALYYPGIPLVTN